MALWDDRGFNTARYGNIIGAACNGISIDQFNRDSYAPMDEEEVRTYNWAAEMLAKAKAEGRTILFDVPFDPDDRYDGVYTKSPQQMYDAIRDKL